MSALFPSKASMSYQKPFHQLPAPCIIDAGIVVNKEDMRRLLSNLAIVRYLHFLDGTLTNQGEGYVMEVFADPHQSTLITNQTLYLNVHSFDYLQLGKSDAENYFDLMQDNRQLRLVPLSNPLQDQETRNMDSDAFEAMVTQVLSAQWDVQIDDDDCPF